MESHQNSVIRDHGSTHLNFAASFATAKRSDRRLELDLCTLGGHLNLGVEVHLASTRFVDGVGEKSAAQYAGIRPNDVLVEIDGKKLEKFDDLKEKIDLAKVGDSVDIKVYRNGKYLDIPVRLKKGL